MNKDQDWGERLPKAIGAGSGDIDGWDGVTNEGWED